MRKPFGDISKEVNASADVHFPIEVVQRPMPHLTQKELFEYMDALFCVPLTDKPENKEFMEDACDAFGNNGGPLQPEDLDVDSVHNE